METASRRIAISAPQNRHMNLALIGYRGTGKTTVAQLLAAHLGWPWCDADVEVETRAGKSIKQIFADEGESAFRDREQTIVAELTARDRWVLALGGGAILREPNRACLRGRCHVVWLTATPATLAARIAGDATTAERRPALLAGGGLAEIATLLAAREPLYRDCADCIVSTEDRTPQSIAAEILGHLGPALGESKVD